SQGLRAARRRAEASAAEADRRRRELEQEVAQRRRLADQLAEEHRRKDEFLATLGHELRNPLAPLRNAREVMRELELADPRLNLARDVIDRQVGQLARLVDDLMDVSRISRGKVTLRKGPVELAEVIRLAVEGSRPLLEARRHEFALALPPEPVWLDAD